MNQRLRTLFAPLAAAAIALAGLSTAFAQPQRIQAGGEDLRPIYANSQDVAEGKHIAEVGCVRCHALNGVSTTAGVPSLAGQRAPYLYDRLKAYREGKRSQGPMGGAVKFLSDDALVKVSAYFASLEPPHPSAAPAKATPAKTDPMQGAKSAAEACSGCHGDNGVSTSPGTPNLAGVDPKFFAKVMKEYKTGQRKNDMMKPVADGLSEADIQTLGLYYALQKPAKSPNKAKGDVNAGKAAATSCAGCHGDNGVSGNPNTPSLAGQDPEYLVDATKAYKDGTRAEESMKGVASALNEATMHNLAAYYAAQTPQPPAVRKPLSTAEWVERCNRCHGTNGNSIEPTMPALASQRADWLETMLVQYRTGERKSGAMNAMASGLSDADIKELAAYYSRQPARPVTYVLVPK